jgi:arylsulfatase
MQGTLNESFTINHATELETPDYLLRHIDDLGTPAAYNHYAIGWAHAMCAPFQWTKQVASHWGGTRNATIVHWPGGIRSKGELRSQFAHVIDVAPTVLDAAGLPEPTLVNGVLQQPMHGTSMRYSFDDLSAPDRHTTQYFEMMCNRGIYHHGWSAITLHKVPWLSVAEMGNPAFDDDTWELYDGDSDFSQARNLAAEHPDKLAELQRLFLIEATKYNVMPLDDRSAERFNPDLAGRPQLLVGTSQTLYPGMVRLSENSVLSLKNKSYTITAKIRVPDRNPASGVLVAQGGAFGGWSFYLHEGRLAYCSNLLGLTQFVTRANAAMSTGTHEVSARFDYDGGGLGRGGTVTLAVDGAPAGTGRVDATQPFMYSMDETLDIGSETGTAVSADYTPQTSAFNGAIEWVRLDAGTDTHDHLVDPEHLHAIAMNRQ